MWVLIGTVLVMASLRIVEAAPGRSRSSSKSAPHTVYDQKQSGGYNIQLHLKDFQIIALMSDELGGLGDYDYSYDYSDFTVKPPGSSTSTLRPSMSQTTLSSPIPPSSISPGVLTSSSSIVPPKPSPLSLKPASPSQAPLTSSWPIQSDTNPSPILSNNVSLVSSFSSTVSSPPLLVSNASEKTPFNQSSPLDIKTAVDATTLYNKPILLPLMTASSLEPLTSSEEASTAAPGKIKVQIIGGPQVQVQIQEQSQTPAKAQTPAQSSLSIIPGEGITGTKPMSTPAVQQQESATHVTQEGGGQSQKEKRCLTGFTRDKWGRCRRVRRPGSGGASQIPFDINRLASLASRFRFGMSESAPHVEIEE